MLTEEELASMRQTMNDSLAGTATVEVSSFVSDGGGGGTTTFAAQGTFDCRVTPASGYEDRFGDRLQPETEVVFTLPQDTTINNNAQIRHGSLLFEVVYVRAPRTFEIGKRVEAREVR